MIVIKTFNIPTNVYIIGNWFKDLDATFGITDDYSTLTISNGRQKMYMETDGWVHILSEQEFNDNKHRLEYPGDCEAMILPNFVGDLSVSVIAEDGEDLLTEYDPEEYLMHQSFRQTNDKDVEDYMLNVPESVDLTQLILIEELLEL